MLPIEWFAFRGRLDLDIGTISRADNVAVDCRGAVLDVIEIENGRAAHDADTHRGDRRRQRVSIQSALSAQSIDGDRQGDISTSYRSAARSSVGPHHVAVDDDLPLSKQLQVDTGPQRPSNEPLNLDGSAPLLSAHRLAWCPLLCGTREH